MIEHFLLVRDESNPHIIKHWRHSCRDKNGIDEY